MPLDGDAVVDGIVAYTYRQREQATVRLKVKGSVAHVVWCDVSKSKQKRGASEIRAVLISVLISPGDLDCFLGGLACLLMVMMLLMELWHILYISISCLVYYLMLSSLILCHLMLSDLFLSYVILSYVILSYVILSYAILSYLMFSRLFIFFSFKSTGLISKGPFLGCFSTYS